jgi:hypothetical protein
MILEKIQVVKSTNYSVHDDTINWDSRVGLKGRGLYATVMSIPPDWDFTIEGLVPLIPNGRKMVYEGLKELIDAGYVQRIDVRTRGGRFVGTKYTFLERPVHEKFKRSPYPVQTPGPSEVPSSNGSDPGSWDDLLKEDYDPDDLVFDLIEPEESAGPFRKKLVRTKPDDPQFKFSKFLLPKKRTKDKFLAVNIPVWAHKIMYRICFMAVTTEEVKLLGPAQRGRVATALEKLFEARVKFEKLDVFEAWWKGDWRSENKKSGQYQPPSPEQVVEFWATAMSVAKQIKKRGINLGQEQEDNIHIDSEALEDIMANRAKYRRNKND